MFLTKIKIAAAAALVLSTVGGGALAYQGRTGLGKAVANPVAADVKPAGEAPPAKNALAEPWNDLAEADEGKALRALLKFAAARKEAAAFFKANVKPVLIDAKRVAALITDLESDKFPVRDQARAELEGCGEYAVDYLQAALDAKPTLDVRKQVEAILQRLKSPVKPTRWVQTVRALAVLEHLGGDEAKTIVEAVSRGRTKAWPTQEAEAALDRMIAKPVVTLPRRWEDLCGQDEGKVARALLGMAGTPKETVAFLKQWVETQAGKPAVGVDAKRIAALIADLGSEQFKTRANAVEELTKLGGVAIPALEKVLADAKTSKEARRQIMGVLIQITDDELKEGSKIWAENA